MLTNGTLKYKGLGNGNYLLAQPVKMKGLGEMLCHWSLSKQAQAASSWPLLGAYVFMSEYVFVQAAPSPRFGCANDSLGH